MEEATKLLAKYYGLPDTSSVVSALGLDKLTSQTFQKKEIDTLPNEIELKLQSILSDTSAGAFLSTDIIKEINKLIGEGGEENEKAINELFEIYFDDKTLIKGTAIDENAEEKRTPIKTMTSYETNPHINDTPNSPSKNSPSVSLMLVNTTRVGMIHKDIHPIVIFLNGIPNVEINRAVPFINVEFYFARPAISEHSGEVQTLSLTRFLEGAQKTQEGDITRQLTEAGSVLGADISVSKDKKIQETAFATAGMELFTSPQTMVNANEIYNRDLRSNPVLDQFRPLMSIQDFQVSVVPSRGLISYKSATLNLILHDRSRLSEVADFVRADLYGKNEIKIEYGWNHPDGDILAGVNNPFGDLINGMRVQEKYGVVNSSFSFDDIGQVNIRLELAMRGGTEFNTEIISSDKDGVGNIIEEIEELQKLVGEYRARLTKNTGGLKTKEINGSQILNAAQDALGNLQLTKELQKSLKTFRKQLNNKDNPPGDAKELAEKLNELFGKEEKKKKGQPTGGTTGELRKTIAASIKNKVDQMWKQDDPFLLSEKTKGGRNVTRKTSKKEREILGENFKNIKSIPVGSSVSLARLLLSFVVEPLVNTKKFDDVQMIFYPFNKYAAYASKLNIANFVVDLAYFVQEFYRYRLEHLAKAGAMNINEFLGFIGKTLVDDPAASSYELGQGGKDAWFKNPYENGVPKETAITMDVADYQAKLEEKLQNVTPNATFKMPQVSFYIEALPERQGKEDNEDSDLDNGRTILRIHVFDKVASSYDTLNAILASSRDSELNAIGSNPTDNEGGKEGVQKAKAREASEVLAKAGESGLLIPVEGSDPKLYNIMGGPQEVKKFLMDSLPYIIYGAGGSTIKGANLASMQDPALNTINLLRSFKKTELQPNGENPGGLPMRIIPTELSLTTLGCPLLSFAQQFFVDFQTGTTADNIYGVYGITHDFKAGEFTTEIKLTPFDAWGKYESPIRKIKNAAAVLEEQNKKTEKATGSE
jgi:hypothetical protein